MKDRYVLDSNLWIEIERNNPKILERIKPLIQENRICLVDVIVAEVLRGTRTPKDYRRLRTAFANFPQISTDWDRVSRLAFEVARKGFNPPLIDLYIAQAVREHHKVLLTGDRDFLGIAKVRPFRLEILPSD